MCEHQRRAEALIAQYTEELRTDPTKRREALTAIFALRVVFVNSTGPNVREPEYGAACPLSRDAHECAS